VTSSTGSKDSAPRPRSGRGAFVLSSAQKRARAPSDQRISARRDFTAFGVKIVWIAHAKGTGRRENGS
jgi:hypothetical protein